MKLKQNIAFFVAILLVLYSCSVHEKQEGKQKAESYLCDVENINTEKWRFTEARQKDFYFQNVESQSADEAFSGKYSSKLFPGAPYGMTCELTNVKPDDYLKITVWRKSKNHAGVIAVDGGEGFYYAAKHIIEKAENGWEKIFLEYQVPPNFYGRKVRMYVWNNSQDTVYFDDLEITHQNKKIYPEYDDVKGLQMHVDQVFLDNIKPKRLKAFETGVLVNSDDDYENAVLFDGNDFLNSSFRLKGDLVDHLQGEKWSFRIKLKKGFAWKNMRTFSVQNPATRFYLSEWLAHRIFHHEDILTTRYGFIPLRMNKKSLGIYAWEEHFEKQLVESNARREGPIVRFDESVFWQRVLETKVTGRQWDIDYFGANRINPFKAGKTAGDSLLSLEFYQAQKLLLQYKKREKKISEIFDVNKLAQYYALIDLTQAYHGFTWHNQRFYYNPVTCLLEPIAFDGYIETGVYKRIDEPVTGLLAPWKIKDFSREEVMMFQVFADPAFNTKYIDYLNRYSSEEFINTIIAEYGAEADSLASLLKREFPFYSFDFEMLKKQAELVRNNIQKIQTNVKNIGIEVSKIKEAKFAKAYTTDVNKNLMPLLVNAYFNGDENRVEIFNFSNNNIKILGVFIEGALPESFENRPVLKAYDGVNAPTINLPVSGKPIKLLFSVNDEMFESPVSLWPAPAGLTERQKTLAQGNTSNLPFVSSKKIVFDGDYSFSTDVIIPDSVAFEIKAGTKIDLVNSAAFISFSPVKIIGTENNPVTIMSSDFSAKGFNIIQPEGKSILKYTHFSGLSSLQKQGWTSPAAVCFYEADVDFENCTFAQNKNCDDALNVVRSHVKAVNCTFENTFADAFDSDFSTGVVDNCIFKTIGNDAIDFSGSRMLIKNCEMVDIADKAVSGGEQSTLSVENCKVKGANIGVASKDLSLVTLKNMVLEKTVYGLVAFVKKPEYGPAKIVVDNLKMKNNVIFHQIEIGSELTLNGQKINGKEKNIAVKLYQ